MKELAREKIQKQIKDPPVVKDLPKSKSKKAKVSKPPTKEAQLTKGKSYKSSMNRDVTKKDPNSKDVLIKKYVKDTNAGGSSKRVSFGVSFQNIFCNKFGNYKFLKVLLIVF